MRHPNDDFPRWMMIMLMIVISYFIAVIIPQVIFNFFKP